MAILAIDPGGTTGIAIIDETGEPLTLIIVPRADLYKTLPTLVKPSVVVIEDFIGGGPRTTEAIYTLKLIGGVQAICELWQMPLVVQVPQQRIPFLPDAKRRAFACDGSKVSIHSIDAYAHALAYLERSQQHVLKS